MTLAAGLPADEFRQQRVGRRIEPALFLGRLPPRNDGNDEPLTGVCFLNWLSRPSAGSSDRLPTILAHARKLLLFGPYIYGLNGATVSRGQATLVRDHLM
jgi:hypothetical protein